MKVVHNPDSVTILGSSEQTVQNLGVVTKAQSSANEGHQMTEVSVEGA